MFNGRKDAPSISCQDSCQHLPASLFFFFGHPGLCPPVEGKQRLSLLPWESIFPPCLWHQPLLCILRIRSPPLLVDILMPGFASFSSRAEAQFAPQPTRFPSSHVLWVDGLHGANTTRGYFTAFA